MNTIKYKIQGYDEETNSIIVSYCSDETATNNPDDYAGYALQPIENYPDVTDMEELKKKIALEGIGLAEQIKKTEQAKANTAMQNQWKALVGQTFEYNVNELTATNSEVQYTNEINVPESA